MQDSKTKPPGASRATIYTIAAVCFVVMTGVVVLQVVALQVGPLPTVPTPAPAAITEIILERTECYGGCPIDTLVLRPNGTAVYTGKNTQRTGQFTGTFSKGDFDKLTQWLISAGFFELNGSYGSPNIDTPSQVIRAARDGKLKSVVNHEIRGSATLWGMQRVIQGAASDIQWQPVRSGIRGVAAWKPPSEAWRPLSSFTILIYPSDGSREFSIRTNDEGRFEIALLPGTYRIEPLVFGRSPQFRTQPRMNPQQTVVVQPDAFSEASFRLDRATGQTTMADGVTAFGDGPVQK
jgi:hypothetical protein